ncbi:MAG: ECF transporter S component [Candidatus Izemoplasmatales bacterium]|jgi:riboflavin transporter FmnP|nr:ECF transporter S component [Candidatus Izemoplasmatales bacterium]
MEIYWIAGLALVLALLLMFLIGKNTNNHKRLLIISILAWLFIIIGLTYAYLFLIKVDGERVEISTIILIDIIITAIYLLFFGLILRQNYAKNQLPKAKITTQKIAVISLLIGIASVLMLISFPVMPAAPYLKVELSALIIFMTLIWFDFKTAVTVSFITNFVHFFLPSSQPVIPLLDEMMNFMATMLFIIPTAIFISRKKILNLKVPTVILWTGIGFVSTTVFMVLYNQFINLPYIYGIQMTFSQVLIIFGVFNLIKWGLNMVVINLTWRRFYFLRDRFNKDSLTT